MRRDGLALLVLGCLSAVGCSQLERLTIADEKGVWMSIWVDDVDVIYERCIAKGLEVTWPPTDMPWNVREMHVRHPDGHVFRISKGIEEE